MLSKTSKNNKCTNQTKYTIENKHAYMIHKSSIGCTVAEK